MPIESDVMACRNVIPPVERVVRTAATQAEKDEAVRLFESGVKVTKIAKQLGRAQSTISRWVGTDTKYAEKHKRKNSLPIVDAKTDGLCDDTYFEQFDEISNVQNDVLAEIKEEEKMAKIKEKEPVGAATPTSSEEAEASETIHLNDTTIIALCQEALLKIGDRIVEADGDSYILGYIHSVLDLINLRGDGND